MTTTTEAQQEFDSKYITSAQIMQDLNINRTNLLYARRTGKLPEPIVVNDGRLFIWVRDEIAPYLAAWQFMLKAKRRGN